ncbi:hypothetical protein KSF_085800 [Reticulibacter mediterranei]|uniref:Uncharacterized protein n=1 Tax=Reticulibacter mediterranei TaxID=2778369 RepID=A0A8J3IXC9_9CHLR|nr:hypothetical protein KSF_085800 [Reticulibacter mediterranei]
MERQAAERFSTFIVFIDPNATTEFILLRCIREPFKIGVWSRFMWNPSWVFVCHTCNTWQ